MGNEMGNSNTSDLIEEERTSDEQLGRSSPGPRHQDVKIIGSEVISTAKDDDLHGKTKSPGNADVGDTISGEREQPAASEELSTKTEHHEDNEKQKTTLSETSADDGNLMDGDMRVEKDDQLESADLSTKEPETFTDSTADLKEPVERLNDIPGISESMEQTGHLGVVVSADIVPDAIREPVQNVEEVELENNEVLHLDGNRVENVTEIPMMEFLDGDRGTATETELTELDKNEASSQVEAEDDTDGQNGSFDEFKETSGSDEPNDQPQCDEVLGFGCTSNDEGDIKETPESDEPNDQPQCDEVLGFGCTSNDGGDIKETLESDESDHQPQCDEYLGLEIASKEETTLTDVCLFESANYKQCHLEAELIAENGSQVDVSRESSKAVGIHSDHEEKEPTEKVVLLEVKEAMEASNLVGDDNCDGIGAADQLITSPAAKRFDDEETQTCDSFSSSALQSSGAATFSDFEFEEITVDLPEIAEASLCLESVAKALENAGGDQFPKAEISGTVNGKQEQQEEEAIGRLSSGSISDSITSNSFPQMQKSPSFGLDIQAESDHTPLLFQDKAEIRIPIQEDKAVMVERSDSAESKTPLLGSPTPEEKEELPSNTDAATPSKRENRNGLAMARGKERRSVRPSFFGMCLCCGINQAKDYRV